MGQDIANKCSFICRGMQLYNNKWLIVMHVGKNRWYEMELIFKRSAYDDSVPDASSDKRVQFQDDRRIQPEADPLEEYWE